jgi:hypothetical protein
VVAVAVLGVLVLHLDKPVAVRLAGLVALPACLFPECWCPSNSLFPSPVAARAATQAWRALRL